MKLDSTTSAIYYLPGHRLLRDNAHFYIPSRIELCPVFNLQRRPWFVVNKKECDKFSSLGPEFRVCVYITSFRKAVLFLFLVKYFRILEIIDEFRKIEVFLYIFVVLTIFVFLLFIFQCNLDIFKGFIHVINLFLTSFFYVK